MLKRNLSLVLLSSALTLPAFTHEISFGAGALDINMSNLISFTDTTLPGITPTLEWNSNASSITGEFYLGYAYNINKGFDIGAEFFYDISGPLINQYVADQSYIESKLSNIFGIRIVPGFNITPSTRLFFDVGYLFMQMDLNTTNLAGFTPATSTSSSSNKRTGAIQYGVGIETMLYESMGLRASYAVTPTLNSTSSNGTSVTSADGKETYDTQPTFYAFYLGGVIRFGF